ncbi:pantoate--beta-alanine ligase [Micromonospora sp. HM5-17]|uniref:pantoate--beta-alanine ligase n=1 Tax=Micromonospora sp. HM5-17 TaxID=2487710 RepID=UPI000F480E60|nr:pantoate--beta-alanine ligase [Micromonospora sp. HM5-17]ROT28044.1 pantoate--beta-alanine ligase [Micromonospora sp. HM5-17]
MTEVLRTRAELASALASRSGTLAVVMTMGALHSGHEALLRAARERADDVLATIFVNPLQFGPNEDFDRYPRTFDADLAVCAAAGVRYVFAPSREEMYPDGEPMVRVNPGGLGEELEGASRPGFFTGVLTVVLKLLNLIRPDVAFFGEKDYQQLVLVRRMVRDLALDVEIVGVPTVREPDGLALSSRNRYLSAAERTAALSLSAALRAGAEAAAAGRGADGALAAAFRAFGAGAGGGTPDAVTGPATGSAAPTTAGESGAGAPAGSPAAGGSDGAAPAARLDYLVLTDPELGPPPATGPARMLIAAWVGTTRLIDNMPVELAPVTPEG